MEWTEVIVQVPVEEVERAGDIAQMVVPYGIYIEDYSHLEEEAGEIAHIDLFDEALLQKDRTIGLVHVYISPEENPQEAVAYLTERYAAAGISSQISTADCAMEDWMNNWKKYFKPIEVGKRLLVRPVWEEMEDAKGRVVLDLEPGLAFGTGTHETTRLCMQMLERYVKQGDRVLDLGCGSGILSVAALLLGASEAVGVDIDELAVKTARENADLNRVGNRFTALCGDLTDGVNGIFQVVVANIVADVILRLTKEIDPYLAPDAVYLMSGIIDTRVQEVKNVLEEAGFVLLEEKEEKGWFALAAHKK